MILLGLSSYSQSQNSSSTEEEVILSSVKSQYELVAFVHSMQQSQDPHWLKVEVLMDFERKPFKIVSYTYRLGSEPSLVSLSDVSSQIWESFFRGNSLDVDHPPKQIQFTICKDRKDAFPMSVHYESTKFGGVILGAELKNEDHRKIAATLEEPCEHLD
jgi:hypothetical protein